MSQTPWNVRHNLFPSFLDQYLNMTSDAEALLTPPKITYHNIYKIISHILYFSFLFLPEVWRSVFVEINTTVNIQLVKTNRLPHSVNVLLWTLLISLITYLPCSNFFIDFVNVFLFQKVSLLCQVHTE